MSELIIVVSSARAGSTNLRRVLQAFRDVETFGEAFNPTGGMDGDRIVKVAEFLGANPADVDGARVKLREAARADPVGTIGRFLAYADAQGARFAEVKALPGHFPAPVFEAIVRKHRPIGVFLYRSPLDVFISLEKAKTLGRFRRVDTTDVKPTIAAKDFINWKFKQQNHYQMATYLFRKMGCKTVSIAYEDMYADPRSPLEYVAARFKETDVDLGPYDEGAAQFMTKQDRGSDRARKVANWDAFHADVLKLVPAAEIDVYRFDGNPMALWAQARVEQVVPHDMKKRLAAMAYAIQSLPTRVLGMRRTRT